MKTNNQWREFFRCQKVGVVPSHWLVVLEEHEDVSMQVVRVNGTAVAWRYHGSKWTCISEVDTVYVEELVLAAGAVISV